ncbi:MAG: hypothetical protein Q7T11_00475 [Deltaproteobacteria bacterium]|nr:hypothetical protein [Deltaproteobacteria bacterium]
MASPLSATPSLPLQTLKIGPANATDEFLLKVAALSGAPDELEPSDFSQYKGVDPSEDQVTAFIQAAKRYESGRQIYGSQNLGIQKIFLDEIEKLDIPFPFKPIRVSINNSRLSGFDQGALSVGIFMGRSYGTGNIDEEQFDWKVDSWGFNSNWVWPYKTLLPFLPGRVEVKKGLSGHVEFMEGEMRQDGVAMATVSDGWGIGMGLIPLEMSYPTFNRRINYHLRLMLNAQVGRLKTKLTPDGRNSVKVPCKVEASDALFNPDQAAEDALCKAENKAAFFTAAPALIVSGGVRFFDQVSLELAYRYTSYDPLGDEQISPSHTHAPMLFVSLTMFDPAEILNP